MSEYDDGYRDGEQVGKRLAFQQAAEIVKRIRSNGLSPATAEAELRQLAEEV